MIEVLKWDMEFFGKKIGVLKKPPSSKRHIKKIIDYAEKNGFKYIMCRLKNGSILRTSLLEEAGFYLSDIGVLWEMDLENTVAPAPISGDIRAASEKDISAIRKMVKGLFVSSRFYTDPFFRKDADRFFMSWVENSVKGNMADAVFYLEGAGLVTCRRLAGSKGTIPLIGIIKGKQGRGHGSALINKALGWFKKGKIKKVTVKTQLTNVQAMNFYRTAGFYISGSDIVMSKIL